jgi:serine/threonine protein kinase
MSKPQGEEIMNLDTLCVGCMDNNSGEPICPKCGSPFQLSATDMLQLKPRTILRGQYLIGRTVAQDSFGITYLARDIAMQTKVALTEYLPQGLVERNVGQTTIRPSSPACQEAYEFGLNRFLEEAQALKKFSGIPNVVAVENIFRGNGTAYLATELSEGMTLEAFLESRDRTISLESAQRILTPAMDALSSVHEQGGLHGDVSTASIFLCDTGKAKLIGFGMARQALAKKTRNQSLLNEGYAAEELYRPSGLQNPATDIYGLAATFYRAITGKVPPSALDRLADDQLRTPSQLGIAISPSAEQALLKALSVRAAERFQSVEEFRKALTGPATAAIPIPPPKAIKTAIPVPPASAKAKTAALFAPLLLVAARLRSHKRLATVGLLALLALATASAALHFAAKRGPDDPQDQPVASQQQQPADQSDQGNQGDDQQQQQQQQPQDQPSQDGDNSQSTDQQQQPDQAPAPPPLPVVRPGIIARAAPVALPDPPVAPAVIVPAPVVVAGYDHLLAHAEVLSLNGHYIEASEVLTRAIAANPARWQAYNSLAKIQLYYLNTPDQAFANYREAIAHGGHASFRVRHDHGGEGLGIACSGWLNVTAGRASYQADNGAHTFAFAPVKEAKRNKFVGRMDGGHGFHIRLMNNQNYNFAPTSSAPRAEVDFIVSVVG